MRALTVLAGTPHSMKLDEAPEPPQSDGDVLVATRVIGICGTDREIEAGRYSWAPPDSDRLIVVLQLAV